ncbi:hypothetical protein FKM82_021600 [Ascaphus truei]
MTSANVLRQPTSLPGLGERGRRQPQHFRLRQRARPPYTICTEESHFSKESQPSSNTSVVTSVRRQGPTENVGGGRGGSGELPHNRAAQSTQVFGSTSNVESRQHFLGGHISGFYQQPFTIS